MWFSNDVKNTCYNISILTIGVLMILSSVVILIHGESFFKQQLHKSLVLRPNTDRLNMWTKPPVKIYRKYYFFNVENPNEIQQGNKPILTERGPYVYSQTLEKRKIEFLNPNMVKFKPVNTLHFEASMSNGSEKDSLNILNVPLITTIEKSSNLNQNFLKFLISHFEAQLFISRSVKDIVSGYDDPFMDLAKEVMPDKVKYEKFGLVLKKNGTENEEYLIKTGFNDPTETGQIIKWNNKSKLNFWKKEKANEIKGSDGSFNPVFLTRDQKIYTFNDELCRSYPMTYLRDNIVDGIHTLDFHLPENIFDNSTLNPDNDGFCDEDCLGNGVFNLSNCVDGVSTFLSFPHFLNAESKFVNSVHGLNPDKELHDFIMHIEPITGNTISGNARLQINFYVAQNQEIELVKNIKSLLFPFFWFDETIELNPSIIYLISILGIVFKTIEIAPIIMILIGFLCTIWSIGPLIEKCLKRKKFKKYRLSAKKSSTALLETKSLKQENPIVL